MPSFDLDLAFLVPFIIGTWRWSMWFLLKFLPAMCCYRSRKPYLVRNEPRRWGESPPDKTWEDKHDVKKSLPVNYDAKLPTNRDVSLVSPVYDPPEEYASNLSSWIVNEPALIVIVCDGPAWFERLKSMVDENRDLAAVHGVELKLILSKGKGKRQALLSGLEFVHSEIVAFVDDDSRWKTKMLSLLLAPFKDPKVGGVGPDQTVRPMNADGSWRSVEVMADMRLWQRMLEVRAATWADGGASCISGRSAVYRVCIIKSKKCRTFFENDSFLGWPLHSGDDKCLTRYLVTHTDYEMYHQVGLTECTLSTCFDNWKRFSKQILRWGRNTWRSDLNAIFRERRIVWKHPITTILLVDRMIAPFTMIYGLATALYLIFVSQNPVTAGVWVLYLFLARAARLAPYLWEKWEFIIYVPHFVMFSYMSAFLRLYSLCTVYKTGWGTKNVSAAETKLKAEVARRLSTTSSTRSLGAARAGARLLVKRLANKRRATSRADSASTSTSGSNPRAEGKHGDFAAVVLDVRASSGLDSKSSGPFRGTPEFAPRRVQSAASFNRHPSSGSKRRLIVKSPRSGQTAMMVDAAGSLTKTDSPVGRATPISPMSLPGSVVHEDAVAVSVSPCGSAKHSPTSSGGWESDSRLLAAGPSDRISGPYE